MLGKDHALSGGVAFPVTAPFAAHLTAEQLAAGTVLTAGAALLPDLDEPGSTRGWSSCPPASCSASSPTWPAI